MYHIVCFVLANYSCAWGRACPEVWLIYPVRLHRRELMFPLPLGINWRQLLD